MARAKGTCLATAPHAGNHQIGRIEGGWQGREPLTFYSLITTIYDTDRHGPLGAPPVERSEADDAADLKWYSGAPCL